VSGAERDTARCRCRPSFRGRRWNPGTAKAVWSGTFRERSEVLSWLAAESKGRAAVQARQEAGPSFGQLAEEWLDGVRSGSIGRRKGGGATTYSDTTLDGYVRSLKYVLGPEFGARPAGDIDDREWQLWVDRLSREGLSRSRIANHLAVARAIYAWATRPTRRLLERNPLLGVELPQNDERPRTRVADAEEAVALLATLSAPDAVPYALAFYAGLRRAEVQRLHWREVELDGYRLTVSKAKSTAGTPWVDRGVRGHRGCFRRDERQRLDHAWAGGVCLVRPATLHTFKNRCGAAVRVRNVHRPPARFEDYIEHIHRLTRARGISSAKDPRLPVYLSMLMLEYPDTLALGRARERVGLNALATLGRLLRLRTEVQA
jgi:integrase